VRTIPAPELALWKEADTSETSARELRVRVKRPGEVSWTNLSDTLGGDWVLGVRTGGETPDQPASGFALTFLKHATEGSLSPGLADEAINKDVSLVYRPLLYPGRDVEVDARIDAEPWRLWLQGQIEDVEWSGPQVVANCLTMDAVLLATQIEDTTTVRGAPDPGTAVETEIQALATDWALDPPTLLVVGTPDWGVGEYKPTGSVGAQALALAQENGWDLRYKWYETDSNFRWTLYLPPRDKTIADFALGLELMQEVPELKVSRQWVRPRIVVRYNDSTTGQVEEVVVEDTDLITEYGKQALIIEELSPASPILTSAQATALGEYALADLGQPLADARYRIPFLPWLELHDLLALQADDDRYDFDTDFAIVGLSHVVDPVEGWWTEVLLRGGAPAGAFYTWHARSGRQELEEASQITERKVGRTEAEVTLQGVPGSRVAEVWAFEALVDEPFDPEDWPDPAVDTPVAPSPYSAATFLASGHAAAIPSEGQVRAVVLVTKDASGNSLWDWRYAVYPTRPDPSIVDVAVVGQQIQVTGGPGVRSIRMAHRGGTWVAFYDGAGLNINAALADAAGVAGISGTDVWTVDVDAYGVPKSDVTVGVTPSATRATTVYGSGVLSPTTEPQWEVILATAPASLSSNMTIRLRAGNVSAETAKLYAKSNTGTGWGTETEITGDVGPALSTAPTTNTDYIWDCGYLRDDGDPRPRTITFQIRAELLSGATVVDNDWDEVAFTTGP
jgi:hypothetical protein